MPGFTIYNDLATVELPADLPNSDQIWWTLHDTQISSLLPGLVQPELHVWSCEYFLSWGCETYCSSWVWARALYKSSDEGEMRKTISFLMHNWTVQGHSQWVSQTERRHVCVGGGLISEWKHQNCCQVSKPHQSSQLHKMELSEHPLLFPGKLAREILRIIRQSAEFNSFFAT